MLIDIQYALSRARQINGKSVPYTLDEISDEYLVPLRFFEENGLCTRPILTDPNVLPAELRLTAKDLSADGLELFRTGYQNWLAALDRRTPEKRQEFLAKGDVSLLEKHLAKIKGHAR